MSAPASPPTEAESRLKTGRQIPYPADIKSKGWRFELDIERVMQSDTWVLATPEVRPWLLMLWTTAWQQIPCGSMPADDMLLAARIGMAIKQFSKTKSILLRGWWLAEDGRLYHDTIVERVCEMLDYKSREKQRKADYRAKMSTNVPRDNHGTTTGPPRDSGVSDATGTGTGTGTINTNNNSARGKFSMPVDWQPSENWVTIARLAGAPNPTSEEVGEFVSYWLVHQDMERTQHEWEHALVKSLKAMAARPKPGNIGKPQLAETFSERDAKNEIAKWEQMTGRVHPSRKQYGAPSDAIDDPTKRIGITS